MTDRDIVEQLKRLTGGRLTAEFGGDGGDRCVGLDFTDADDVAHSTIRYATQDEKHTLCRLAFRLTGLRALNLRRALIGPLPDGIEALVDLEWLDLGSNALGSVPAGIQALTKLRYLNLGTNEIEVLPDWIGALPDLDDLKLHKNHLKRLPDSLLALTSLRALNLFFNRLKVLPDWFYGLTSLENLVVWNIRNLGDDIARLDRLVWFTNCGCPALRRLPDGLCALPNIRGLRLYQNRLDALPGAIGRLTTLEQLSVYQNELSDLPASFAGLERLWRLNIGWNRFETFPDVLFDLPRLEWLGAYLNPGSVTLAGRTTTPGGVIDHERRLSDHNEELGEAPIRLPSATRLQAALAHQQHTGVRRAIGH